MLNPNLYKKGFVPLHSDLRASGYQLHILPEALEFLQDRIQDNYASFKLIKKIVALRSDPRTWDGGIKKGKTDHRQIAIDGIWVNYFIESGCVCIEKITYRDNAKSKLEPAGLHLVKKENNQWTIKNFYIREVKTKYAAVNGQNNDRETAAIRVMPAQLLNAYNDDTIDEFTLFHNPTVSVLSDTYESARDKLGFTNPMTQNFSEVLNKTQYSNNETNWVTHSQGGAIFSQAVKYHSKKKGTLLNNHTVFFQASANNMMVTKRILKKAGIKLHKKGYNNSPIDGVPQVIGANAITDVLLSPGIGSLVRLATSPLALFPGMLPLAFTGPGFSTHTTPYKGMVKYGKQVASSSKDLFDRIIKRTA